MEVIDWNAPAETRRLKALVYGKSGTGKTGFGVSSPNPLILLNERQAIPHIIAAAKRLGRPVPPTLVMNHVQDYRNVLRALRGDRTKTFRVQVETGTGDAVAMTTVYEGPWPDTVVIDSLTEVCELVSAEIREQSPQKVGKDGLPVDSERYWNVLFDRAAKLIHAFRDIDLNILFLCLLNDQTSGEDDQKVRSIGPQLAMRRLPGVVMASVNVVGVTYRKLGKEKGTSVYGIATSGPEYMELKPFPPIRPAEVMDFASWVTRINGSTDIPAAPEPLESAAEALPDAVPPKTEEVKAEPTPVDQIELKDAPETKTGKAKKTKATDTTTDAPATTGETAQA